MQLGVTLPIKEVGSDLVAVRDFAQTAEGLGCDFLMGYDQLLNEGDPAEGGGAWARNAIDPFVLFAYLADATDRVALLSGVLVLPQRPAVLVAKQAADVAAISGGRLMLGLGVGASPRIYEALGADFRTRGRRFEEQIALMRALWSQPVVDFEGEFHRVEGLGIDPRPPGGSIPIWIGTMATRTLERIGRLADGWVGAAGSPRHLPERRAIVAAAAKRAGRDPAAIGIHMQVEAGAFSVEQQVAHAQRCAEAGVTHLSFNAMDRGRPEVEAHIEALRSFIEAARASGLGGGKAG